jgi:uncharacterized repeat protein (TIGR01451 family)
MRTLSEAFAPRGPLLPEGLRTLEISPNRVVEPGTTVHAVFTFRNLGGGTGSGFRVRFRLPEGLAYLPGTARIDDTPLDEHSGLTTLLQSSGADIGEIPAGGERRISLSYSVATTIENGTPLTLQAAVASFDVPVIGSNIVRLVVSSRPVLQNPKTTLALAAVREALPGEELQLNARIHNSGQSSAHDLVLLLPVPAHTTFSPHSVTIEGRSVAAGSATEPFGIARPTIVAPTLAPGTTIDIGYRVRIDAALEDATPITAYAAICSQEVAEFALSPVIVKVPSAAAFSGEETALRVESEEEVEAGQRVRIVLRAKNVGTARARKLSLKIVLPEGLVYTPSSLAIDDAPAADHGAVPDAIRIGELEPGRSVEVAIGAIVQTPVPDRRELRMTALAAWSKGQRKFERTIVARSAPRFPPNFNKIDRDSAQRVGPGDVVGYTIALQNMGTDVATEVRLSLTADEGLERLRVRDRDTEIAIGDGGIVALDNLEPGVSRSLRVDGRIAGPIEDQTPLRLHAALLTAQIPRVELGSPVYLADSRPKFSAATSVIVNDGEEALRPNRTGTCRLILANEGTDRGRDVRVALKLPDELRLEAVDDASRDGNALVFGDIPAGETREAVLRLRLLAVVLGNEVLTFSGRVGGLNVVPFALNPIEFATHAEASFAEGATLTSMPADTIDAGAEIAYTLSLRNCGDGAAKRLAARVAALSNAVYAPGSTTVNGIALQDYVGTSPLLSEAGLALADVGAGVEVIARWRVIVNIPLPPATAIETSATVHWDDAPEIIVAAAPIRVRSTSALPIVEPELPFSVLGAIAAPTRATTLATRTEIGSFGPAYVELRPALPIRANANAIANANGNGQSALGGGQSVFTNHSSRSPEAEPISTIEYAQLASGNDVAEPAPVADAPEPPMTTVFLELSDEHLAWAVQYLVQTRVGGIVAHLLALRALFPDRVSGGDRLLRARLRSHREMLGEHADRLFIKMRLPDFPLVSGDVETPELRASLVALVEELAVEKNERASLRSGLRLAQKLDHAMLLAAVQELGRDNLATAAPWLVMTRLIGTSLERDGGVLTEFTAYRDALIEEFTKRSSLDAAAFEASLKEPADPLLDEARESVVRTLAEQQRVLN